jgi:hypothetical protein
MSVPLRFMTAIVRKDDLSQHFPGGIPAFQDAFAPAIEDESLYALCSMSSGELGEIVEKLASSGFDTDRHVAIGDMWAGPFHEVPGIVFESGSSDNGMPQWSARSAD